MHYKRGKGYTLHVHAAGVDGGKRDTSHVQTACSYWKVIHIARRKKIAELLMLLLLLYDIQ
jgi:hypothetical protein